MTYLPDTSNLDDWFPRNGFEGEMARLGVVVGGSLSKGLVVKLDREQTIEELAVGRYVVVPRRTTVPKRFFCMLTDIVLNSTNPGIQNHPPEFSTIPF